METQAQAQNRTFIDTTYINNDLFTLYHRTPSRKVNKVLFKLVKTISIVYISVNRINEGLFRGLREIQTNCFDLSLNYLLFEGVQHALCAVSNTRDSNLNVACNTIQL